MMEKLIVNIRHTFIFIIILLLITSIFCFSIGLEINCELDIPCDKLLNNTDANILNDLDNDDEAYSMWYECKEYNLMQEECAGLIATGTCVKDGRSIFLKNRHMPKEDNKPSFYSGANYNYFIAGGMMGMNEAGLAVGNFAQVSQTLQNAEIISDGTVKYSTAMYDVLGQYSTVSEAANYIATHAWGNTQFGIVSAEEGVGAVVAVDYVVSMGSHASNITWVNNSYAALANAFYCDGAHDGDNNDITIDAMCADILANGGINGDYKIDWQEVCQRGGKNVSGKEKGTGTFECGGEITNSYCVAGFCAVSGNPSFNGSANVGFLAMGRQPLVGIWLPLGASYLTSNNDIPSEFRNGGGIEDYVDVKVDYASVNGQGDNTYYCDKVREVQHYANYNENISFNAYDAFMSNLLTASGDAEVKSMLESFADGNMSITLNGYVNEATAGNNAPVVSNIPGQTIVEGSTFATINLDDYVSDVEDSDSSISWSYSGNSELTVSIDANRVATITIPDSDWNGAETITFTAEDTGGLSDSDSAVFTVTVNNGSSGWWNFDWTYRKKITINHTKVDDNLVNFPILFSDTSSDFANHAQLDGDDFAFVGIDNIQYNHEIEKYDSGTGELIAWINVTSLSSADDTVLYLYYGNNCVSNQQNITGTWDSDYLGVWHFNNSFSDSTSYSKDGINTATTHCFDGVVSGCRQNTGDAAMVNITNFDEPFENMTVEIWLNFDNDDKEFPGILCKGRAYDDNDFCIYFRKPVDNQFRMQIDRSQTMGGNIPGDNGQGFWWFCWARYAEMGVNDKAEIYYNDSQVGTTQTFSWDMNNDYDWLWIGNKGPTSQGGSSGWDGKFDEVRFSRIYRSNGWMNATYNTIFSPSTFLRIDGEETQPDDNTFFNKIIIDNNYVDSTLYDFPVLIRIDSSSQLALYAQDDGDDISFWNFDKSTQLEHEIEYYDCDTGKLYAWVKVPIVHSGSDTEFWLMYGDATCGNQENSDVVWDFHFGGVWHLSEANALDSTGNGNTGSQVGSPAVLDGLINKAVSFTPTDEIELGTGSSIDMSNDDEFTVEFWVNFDSSSKNQMCFVQSQGNDWWNVGFGTYAMDIDNNDMKFLHRDDDGTKRDAITDVFMGIGSWHYIVGTYRNGISDYKALYVDGEVAMSTTSNINNLREGPATSTVIGFGGDFGPMDGMMDEVRISNIARSDSWVKASYHTVATPGFVTVEL